MARRYDESVNAVLRSTQEFLKDVEKDVRLAKKVQRAVSELERAMSNWDDRRIDGKSFCEVDGCLDIALFQETLCNKHDRIANREV
jgi:hypothetical protein